MQARSTWDFIGREAARTQSKNLYDQLYSGSRYLDLRASQEKFGDTFYMSHGIIVTNYKLSDATSHLREFSERFPNEIVFATISLEGANAEQERKKVYSTLEYRLVPSDTFTASMTLNSIRNGKRNIVLCDWYDDRYLYRPGIYGEKAYTPEDIYSLLQRAI